MALKSINSTSYGLPVEYWKVSAVHLSHGIKKCQIDLVGYFTEEARRSENSKPIKTKVYSISGDEFDTYFSLEAMSASNVNVMNLCYEYLKIKEEFINSIDV